MLTFTYVMMGVAIVFTLVFVWRYLKYFKKI